MTNNKHKLRVGVIGAGFYAVAGHIPTLRATGRAEVVAIVRRNPQRLVSLQHELGIPHAFTDWREMLESCDLDAVVVTTPNNHHVAPTLAALERGLHVLLEKPSADTIDGALQIAEATEKSGRIVTVGFNTRGTSVWRGVRRSLQTGVIGTLRQINFVCALDGRVFRQVIQEAELFANLRKASDVMPGLVDDWMSQSNWQHDAAQMGGDIFNGVGSHAVDAMLWLAESGPTEVIAFKPRNEVNGFAVLTAQVRLANEVLLSITFNDHANETADTFGGYGYARTTAIGDSGLITVDATSFGVQSANEAWMERDGSRELITTEGESIAPAAAFVASVLDGAPNLCTAEEAAQSVMLIQSIYQSAAEGKVVQCV